MRKHTIPKAVLLMAVVMLGTMGSMQNVSAQDTIKVETVGAVGTKNTGAKKIASAANDSISIEIVVERSDDTDNKSAGSAAKDTTSDKTKPSASSASAKSGSIAGISFDKLVMADVEEAVNIRDAASEDGKLIGKFYKECAGTILETGDGWTKVKTGDVTGWIKNDYLMFGDEAVELAEKVVEKTATSTADCLRVRKTADADGTVLDLLAEGDQIGVLGEEGDWVKVEYSDGEVGYVSADYVTIADSLGTGMTIEEINAIEAAAKKEQEEVAAAAKRAEVEAGRTTETVKTNNGAIATGYSDVVLLAALIQAEAGGQPYEGQVSVGTVVMNRLRSGRYGNSIFSVIYAKSQFGPAGTGQVAQIAAAGPKATCLAAAQDALNGVSYIGGATHFRNISSGYTGIVIGSHVFW